MTDTFIHPQALCESLQIGHGTRVWAFAHILPGAQIGRDCNICDGVFIENDVVVGDRVTVKCGVQLWDGLRVQDDVFIGPNVSFTNDRFPRSKVYPERFLPTVVEHGASIGAGAVILPGLSIGAGAMVGAGAVVTRSVPANAIVVGNPARITGYTETQVTLPDPEQWPNDGHVLGVGDARLMPIPHFADLRGELSAVEFSAGLPFVPQRCFWVYGVPSREVRGEHAHRRCAQFLICMHGSVNVLLDDGQCRAEVRLDSPAHGLYLPPMVWGTQYQYSDDAVLMVFASLPYDGDDYLRRYDEFLRAVAERDLVR